MKDMMIDTKQSENNRLMKYGVNGNIIGWNEYKDSNNYVILYFIKKK